MIHKTILLSLSSLILSLFSLTACTGDNISLKTASDAEGEKLVLISLSANSAGDEAWTYSVIGGNGKVNESTTEAYDKYIQGDEDSLIVDFIIPGTKPFVFEGDKSGEVILKFTYSSGNQSAKPSMIHIVSITVYDDKTLTVTESYSVETNKYIVAILLSYDAVSGGEWTYSAKGGGKVSEASREEYQEQETASESGDDSMIRPQEGVPPGCVAFVLRGIEAGEVELVFACSNPQTEETVKIEVFPDKTLAVIYPEQK